MVKKNVRGFTLVELLVTITLMLSILVISIVSLTGLSKQKKEESWKKVQEQVKLAAEQYFSANEYLLSGNAPFVSVGTLVEEDYLNVVTNPETGKPVDSCDIVRYEDNDYKYMGKAEAISEIDKLIENGCTYVVSNDDSSKTNPGECNFYVTGKKINISKEGKFELVSEINKKKNGSTNQWYGEINRIDIYIGNEKVGSWNIFENNKKLSYSWGGKTCKFTPHIMSKEPTVEINGYIRNSEAESLSNDNVKDGSIKKYTSYTSGAWLNGYVTLIADYSNLPSGITYVKKCKEIKNKSWKNFFNINSEGKFEDISCELKIQDAAFKYKDENNKTKYYKVTSNKVTVKLDRTAPKFDIKMYKEISQSGTSTKTSYSSTINKKKNWYNNYIYAKIDTNTETVGPSGVNYRISTVDGKTKDTRNDNTTRNDVIKRHVINEGEQTISFEVCSNANICTTKTKKVYLDHTEPNCAVSLKVDNKEVKRQDWFTKTVKVIGTCSDEGSGCKSNTVSETYSKSMAKSSYSPGTVYDNAGNSRKCNGISFGIDKDTPSITITGYKKNGNDNVTSSSGLKSYTKNSWYSGYVFVKATYNAGQSGIDTFTCTYENSNGSGNLSTSGNYKYVNVTSEGTTTINCSLKTNSGKTKTESYTVKLDRTPPTCAVTLSGTNKYDNEDNNNSYSGRGWYTSTVNLTNRCSDNGGSGCSSSTSTKTFSSEKTKERYSFGKVKDNAGNESEDDCVSKNFGIEKNVTMEFDAEKTNKTKSISSYDGNGKTIFKKNTENICSFGECTDIKMLDKKNKNREKYGYVVYSGRFARACERVGDFIRYFRVKGTSVKDSDGKIFVDKCSTDNVSNNSDCERINNEVLSRSSNKQINAKDMNLKRSEQLFVDEYDIDAIGIKDYGNAHTVTASKDVFTYVSPAGNKDSVTLYVEYVGQCGYEK